MKPQPVFRLPCGALYSWPLEEAGGLMPPFNGCHDFCPIGETIYSCDIGRRAYELDCEAEEAERKRIYGDSGVIERRKRKLKAI